jgi:hypothetical protein
MSGQPARGDDAEARSAGRTCRCCERDRPTNIAVLLAVAIAGVALGYLVTFIFAAALGGL